MLFTKMNAVMTRLGLAALLATIYLGATASAQAPSVPEVALAQTPTGDGVTGLANDYYIAGRAVRLRIDITKLGDFSNPLVTFFDTEVPPGWQFTGVLGGDSPDVIPLASGGKLSFAWLGRLAFPATFFVEMLVPDNETSVRTINSKVRYVDTNGIATDTGTVSSVLRKDTQAPVLSLIGGGITLNCGQSFADPGVVATDNAEGDLTAQVIRGGDFVNPNVPGRYRITYDVSDRTGNAPATVSRFVAVLSNCPVDQPEGCEGNCADDNGDDLDGDGLTDCQEECIFGTEVDDPDSDGDGMSDAYEADYLPELNPLDPSDRLEDADGDSFNNLEEFLRGGNPLDASSPARSYFVGPGGVDNYLLGTRAKPFRTIAFALQIAGAASTAARRGTVILLDGTYTADVTLRRHVTLTGEANATIIGTVTPVDDSRIERIIIEGVGADDVLVDLTANGEGAAARLKNLTLRNAGVGVLTDGTASADAVIDTCVFEDLSIGLEIRGAVPKVRRSTFRDIATQVKDGETAGVVLRALAAKQDEEVDDEGNLGDTTDAGAGWNTFDINSIEGPAVLNEREEVIKMEANDWKSDDETTIDAAIEGPADFVPFLGAGSAVFASSLFCTVWRADNNERIEDASVVLAPGSYSEVTENEDGVYAFPAVIDGTYTVEVSAPGFEDVTEQVTINPGELASVIIALGETPDNGGCNNGGDAKAASALPSVGDGVLGLFTMALLAAAALLLRRRAV
jgi:hypothetical protein